MGERLCAPFIIRASTRSKKRKKPDVWIVAHEMLFIAQESIRDPSAVVIDRVVLAIGRVWSGGATKGYHSRRDAERAVEEA